MSEQRYGGEDATVEAVMQRILDDYRTGLRLDPQGDTGWCVTPYEASFATWEDGLTELTDLIGWAWCREGERVVLFEPDREPDRVGDFVHKVHISYVDPNTP
jgi:hypothetical protein